MRGGFGGTSDAGYQKTPWRISNDDEISMALATVKHHLRQWWRSSAAALVGWHAVVIWLYPLLRRFGQNIEQISRGGGMFSSHAKRLISSSISLALLGGRMRW